MFSVKTVKVKRNKDINWYSDCVGLVFLVLFIEGTDFYQLSPNLLLSIHDVEIVKKQDSNFGIFNFEAIQNFQKIQN